MGNTNKKNRIYILTQIYMLQGISKQHLALVATKLSSMVDNPGYQQLVLTQFWGSRRTQNQPSPDAWTILIIEP